MFIRDQLELLILASSCCVIMFNRPRATVSVAYAAVVLHAHFTVYIAFVTVQINE